LECADDANKFFFHATGATAGEDCDLKVSSLLASDAEASEEEDEDEDEAESSSSLLFVYPIA
jgi:hypothetical protein